MRRLLVFVLVLAAVAACSDDGSSVDDTDASGLDPDLPSRTLPAVPPPTTSIMHDPLPPTLWAPGEPSSYPEPADVPEGSFRIADIDVEMPDDFLDREDLIICVNTPDRGWHGCSDLRMQQTLVLSTTHPDELSIVLLREVLDEETGYRREAVRRLAVLTLDEGRDIRWRVHRDYSTLAELVTLPPQSDGRYIEAIG